MEVVLLQGLNGTAAAWDHVIAELSIEPEIEARALSYPDPALHPEMWTIHGITDFVAAQMNEPAHICGLSLGGLIGIDLANRYPELVLSLFSSAPQAKPFTLFMWVQEIMLRIAPRSFVCPPGMSKRTLHRLLNSVFTHNLGPELSATHVPTTIVCGTLDVANMLAAHRFAAAIPGSRFQVVKHVGHSWHIVKPRRFAAHLRAHLNWATHVSQDPEGCAA